MYNGKHALDNKYAKPVIMTKGCLSLKTIKWVFKLK